MLQYAEGRSVESGLRIIGGRISRRRGKRDGRVKCRRSKNIRLWDRGELVIWWGARGYTKGSRNLSSPNAFVGFRAKQQLAGAPQPEILLLFSFSHHPSLYFVLHARGALVARMTVDALLRNLAARRSLKRASASNTRNQSHSR